MDKEDTVEAEVVSWSEIDISKDSISYSATQSGGSERGVMPSEFVAKLLFGLGTVSSCAPDRAWDLLKRHILITAHSRSANNGKCGRLFLESESSGNYAEDIVPRGHRKNG